MIWDKCAGSAARLKTLFLPPRDPVLRWPELRSGTSTAAKRLQLLARDEFAQANDALELALQRLDHDFLAAGNDLERLLELSAGLVTHSQLLLKMSVGQEGGESIFEEAAAVLLKPLEFADRLSGEWPDMLRDIRGAVSDIGRLRELRFNLDRVVSPLDVLQRMFRIECSSLDDGTQALFSTLTTGMQEVRLEMFGMIEGKFTVLEASVKTLHEIENQLGLMIRKSEASRQERLRIRENLDRTRQQLSLDLSKDVALSGVTQSIQKHVSDVVTSLQAQDLVNQRTRHVMDLITGLGSSLKDPRKVDPKLCRDAATVARAQLEAVALELGVAKSTITNGLQSILRLMEDLDREVLHLSGIDLSSTADGGLVQTLLETGEQARVSLRAIAADSRKCFETVRPISSLVGNLSSDMASISERMRLIALNTQIQSAHAGAGTGLDVLATRTSAISDDTALITQEMAVRLTNLQSNLDATVRRVENVVCQAALESEALDLKSVREEAVLHAFRDKSLQTLADLDRLGLDVQEHVRQMCDSIAETADIGRAGAHMGSLLGKIAEFGGVGWEAPEADQSSLLLKDFRKLYSMASERELHDALLGPEQGAAGPDPGQTHAAAGSIDFF